MTRSNLTGTIRDGIFIAIFTLFLATGFVGNTLGGSVQAGSPDSSQQRPCTNQDISGHIYKMVDFHETPPRKLQHKWIAFPYQYVSFENSDDYGEVAMGREPKNRKYLEDLLAQRPEVSVMKYTLSADGILSVTQTVYGNVTTPRFTDRCVEIMENTKDYEKGDLVLTGKNETETFKRYRILY